MTEVQISGCSCSEMQQTTANRLILWAAALCMCSIKSPQVPVTGCLIISSDSVISTFSTVVLPRLQADRWIAQLQKKQKQKNMMNFPCIYYYTSVEVKLVYPGCSKSKC